MSKWTLKENTAEMNWEFWHHAAEQDSAQGATLEFRVPNDEVLGTVHDRKNTEDLITRIQAEQICRGLNLAERFPGDSGIETLEVNHETTIDLEPDNPHNMKLVPRTPYEAPANITSPGIDDLIFNITIKIGLPK